MSVLQDKEHVCVLLNTVFIKRQTHAIVAVEEFTGQAAEGGHKCLN